MTLNFCAGYLYSNVRQWYFPRLNLDRLIYSYPGNKPELTETEETDRLALVDFFKGLLEFDPNKRWSPVQVWLLLLA